MLKGGLAVSGNSVRFFGSRTVGDSDGQPKRLAQDRRLLVFAASSQRDLVTRPAVAPISERLATFVRYAELNSHLEIALLAHPDEVSKVRHPLRDCSVETQRNQVRHEGKHVEEGALAARVRADENVKRAEIVGDESKATFVIESSAARAVGLSSPALMIPLRRWPALAIPNLKPRMAPDRRA
jgi:hypothetical protein